MAYPTFDGFSLQDDNYIVSDIEFRTTPNRSTEYQLIARRPGAKLLAHDFAERKVKMSGYIVADNASELQSKIDDLHRNVTRKDDGSLFIESDRYATATVTSVSVADPHYAQDFIPFEIDFLLADPFFYGTQRLVTITVASGTIEQEFQVTISGSIFAEPSIAYSAPDGTGDTTTEEINIEYSPTAEIITWSGTSQRYMQYGTTVTFDYLNQIITEGTDQVDLEGVFARWDPGTSTVTVTFSGEATGGEINFSYLPRYL